MTNTTVLSNSGTKTPTRTQSVVSTSTAGDPPTSFPSPVDERNNTDQARLQEEYMRALLSGMPQGQQDGDTGEEDQMIKMMQNLLGGMSGEPGAAPGPGIGGLPFSAEDVSKMTGIPPFLTNMFLGPAPVPPTEAEKRTESLWKLVRVVLSSLIGIYTIWIVNKSVELFGQNPPAPATAQNPFVIFVMAELLVHGARTMTGRTTGNGLKGWFQSVKDIGRDGAIVIFLLGCNSWWRGDT